MRATEHAGSRTLRAVLIAAACMVLGPGCAKISDPLPPEILVPEPAADLAACQQADSVVLTFTRPSRNTDGSEARTLARIDLFRLTGDIGRGAAEGPAALSDEEFLLRAGRIQSVAAADLPPGPAAETITFRDRPGFPDPPSMVSRRFGYAVLFVNNRNQAAGLSNRVSIAPVPVPLPPGEIRATVTEDSIRLEWDAPAENSDGSRPANAAGYDVFRTDDPKNPPQAPLNRDPLPTPEFDDRDFQFDRVYAYAVRTVASLRNPRAVSELSGPVRVTPRDTFPPDPPSDFHAVREGKDAVLLWAPSPSKDVAGYRIYLEGPGSGDRVPLQGGLITTASHRDAREDSGAERTYALHAVDGHGNESVPVRTVLEGK